jgi:excisionase family DNA binding protein
MSSMMSAAITSSRRCENGETCVAYAQLREPAKLFRYNEEDICSACRERRLDAEVAGASEESREEPRRRRYGAGTIYRQPTGSWRARYNDKDGGRCSISGPTREEVEAKLVAAVAERDRSKKKEEYVAERNGGTAMRRMLEQMMETLMAGEVARVLAQAQETQKALAEILERAEEAVVRLEEAADRLEAKEELLSRGGALRHDERQGGSPERHYTVGEAADLLGMHPESLRREIRAGAIRAEKLSARRTRISTSQLRGFVERRGQEYGAA